MNHSREFNIKIKRIHERALRIVYSDNKSTYVERLEKDHSITIHTKNLQVLITEMFKLQNETSATIRSSYQMCSIKTKLSLRSKRGCVMIALAICIKYMCNMKSLFNFY